MPVFGVDMATTTMCVALARRGGVDIMVNEASNRHTPTLITYDEKRRYVGQTAAAVTARHFQNTISNVKHVIGRTYDEIKASGELAHISCPTTADATTGELAYRIAAPSGQLDVSATQAYSALLDNAATTASADRPVRSCVVAVPAHYSQARRLAVLAAAEVAGLQCYRVISEPCAVGFAYSVRHHAELLAASTETPGYVRPVLVVDIGESGVTASVIRFSHPESQVICSVTSQAFGGRTLDAALEDIAVEHCKAQWGLDPRTRGRALYRLRNACVAAKKTLSSNQQAGINVECLMEERDLHMTVKRADFEARWMDKMRATVEEVIREALSRAELVDNVASLHSVELMGGTTRVPGVIAALEQLFTPHGVALKRTLNSEEAIAIGAAWAGAVHDPMLQFGLNCFDFVQDTVALACNGVAGKEIFKAGEPVAAKVKQVPFSNRVEPLGRVTMGATASHTGVFHGPEGQDQPLIMVDLPTLAPAPGAAPLDVPETPAKVVLRLSMNFSKIIEVISAERRDTVTRTVTEKVKNPDYTAPEEGAETEVPEFIEQTREVSDVVTRPIPVSVIVAGAVPAARVQALAALEKTARDAMLQAMAQEHAFNDLESYISDLRDLLSGPAAEYYHDPDSVLGELDEAEDWLYNEGEDAPLEEIQARYNTFKAIGDAVRMRRDEAAARPAALARARALLQDMETSLKSTAPEYEHIGEEARAPGMSAIAKCAEWLSETEAAAAHASPAANPNVKVADIRAETEKVFNICKKILAAPKPKPKPEPKPETEAEAEAKPEVEGETA